LQVIDSIGSGKSRVRVRTTHNKEGALIDFPSIYKFFSKLMKGMDPFVENPIVISSIGKIASEKL